MNVDGLQSSTILGISGPLWRTFDIICAQWLLARTFGHAVGASHWVTHGTLPLFLHFQSLQSLHAQQRYSESTGLRCCTSAAAGRHCGWLSALYRHAPCCMTVEVSIVAA